MEVEWATAPSSVVSGSNPLCVDYSMRTVTYMRKQHNTFYCAKLCPRTNNFNVYRFLLERSSLKSVCVGEVDIKKYVVKPLLKSKYSIYSASSNKLSVKLHYFSFIF